MEVIGLFLIWSGRQLQLPKHHIIMASSRRTEQEEHDRNMREMLQRMTSPSSGLFAGQAHPQTSTMGARQEVSGTFPWNPEHGRSGHPRPELLDAELTDSFLPEAMGSVSNTKALSVRLPAGMMVSNFTESLKTDLCAFDFEVDVSQGATAERVAVLYLKLLSELGNRFPAAGTAPIASQFNTLFSVRNALLNAAAKLVEMAAQGSTSSGTRTSGSRSAADRAISFSGPHDRKHTETGGSDLFSSFVALEVSRDKWASSMFYKMAHHEGSLGFTEDEAGNVAEPPHINQIVDALRATLSRYPIDKTKLKRLMDFENPINLKDYHPDAAARPIVGIHRALSNLATACQKVHGIAFHNRVSGLDSHGSSMVIYFMDEHGGNVQATLFLEYSQEALSIWTSEVVAFFESAPWNRKPTEMSRGAYLMQTLPRPGFPIEFEDQQTLKDIVKKAQRNIENALNRDARDNKPGGEKRKREREELLDTRPLKRQVPLNKFPLGLDLAALTTVDAKGTTVCRRNAAGVRCFRGEKCPFSHAVTWTADELERARKSATAKMAQDQLATTRSTKQESNERADRGQKK